MAEIKFPFPELLASKKTWTRAMINFEAHPPVTVDADTKIVRKDECIIFTFNDQPISDKGNTTAKADIESHILIKEFRSVDYFTMRLIETPSNKIIT